MARVIDGMQLPDGGLLAANGAEVTRGRWFAAPSVERPGESFRIIATDWRDAEGAHTYRWDGNPAGEGVYTLDAEGGITAEKQAANAALYKAAEKAAYKAAYGPRLAAGTIAEWGMATAMRWMAA